MSDLIVHDVTALIESNVTRRACSASFSIILDSSARSSTENVARRCQYRSFRAASSMRYERNSVAVPECLHRELA